jgi:hypothetical protein
MAKPRKKPTAQSAAPEPRPTPLIGDKVTMPRTKSVLEVTHVSRDGDEVNLQLAGTNLEWFRVRTDTLTFVERKPPARTSNPFTNPAPAFDTDEILERITTVQEENLKRLDDDVEILKAYLKSHHAPRTAIEALEALIVEQHVSWKKAVTRIKKLLEE